MYKDRQKARLLTEEILEPYTFEVVDVVRKIERAFTEHVLAHAVLGLDRAYLVNCPSPSPWANGYLTAVRDLLRARFPDYRFWLSYEHGEEFLVVGWSL